MSTTCDICNKKYSNRTSLLRHIRTIHECSILNIKNADEQKYACKYCKKEYKHAQSRHTHEQRCKQSDTNIELAKLLEIEQEKQKIKDIEIAQLKLKLEHAKEIIAINNETTQHERKIHKNTVKLYNTTINTINNLLEQITISYGKDVLKNFILPLGAEDLHLRLTLENKKQIMCSRKGAINKITEFSNCLNPQFNNVILTNLKDKIIFIYCDKKGKFIKEDMDTVLSDIFYYRVEDLKTIFKEMVKTKQINTTEINHITNLLTNIETNNEYKQSKIICLQELLQSYKNTITRNINNRIQYALDYINIKDNNNNIKTQIFDLEEIDDYENDSDNDSDTDKDFDN